MRHQPRASTEPEPSDRQSLMCIAIAAGLLVLLWFGPWDSAVRWVVH